jgi:mannose-6-phosphate isomerase-like protein (cupin superfamily)
VATINPDQTMVIPKGVSHSFTAVGVKVAKILTFFPSKDGMEDTVYFQGKPPEVYNKKSES